MSLPPLCLPLPLRDEQGRVGIFEVGMLRVVVAHTMAGDTQVVETLSFLKGASLTQG